jgi:hypothetical protein
MCGCPQATNIFDDPTSKYSTINIRCRIAQSVERKTDIREVLGSIPAAAHFFSLQFYSCIGSEVPTGNAANVNMLDLPVEYEVQFSIYRNIWVYPVININKIIKEQIGRPCENLII